MEAGWERFEAFYEYPKIPKKKKTKKSLRAVPNTPANNLETRERKKKKELHSLGTMKLWLSTPRAVPRCSGRFRPQLDCHKGFFLTFLLDR